LLKCNWERGGFFAYENMKKLAKTLERQITENKQKTTRKGKLEVTHYGFFPGRTHNTIENVDRYCDGNF